MTEATFPECCKFCPHKETVKANCGHAQVQMLATYLAEEEDRTCPVFEERRSATMADLARTLPRSS